MIQTIRVSTSKGSDILGESIFQDAKQFSSNLLRVSTTRVFRLEGITRIDAIKLAEILFSEDVNQKHTINESTKGQDALIEIGYKPGVMNPEVGSIIKVAKDLQIPLIAADSSTAYEFSGLNRDEVRMLVSKLKLYNPMIEHIVETPPETLIREGSIGNVSTIPLRTMNKKELTSLSEKNLLALDLQEMETIAKYFSSIERDPTDCELEVLAQTWSEHCVHKTFKANLIIDGKKQQPFFKRIKSTAKKSDKRIVSAFIDNAGVIELGHGYAVNGKVETHNSPSAIEPYGGAMTGSGGVFRDVLGTGQGAKPLISTDIFCFAPPDLPEKNIPPGALPPGYIMKRVISGVRDYGNRVGIPTNNGSLHFHKDFRAKPTVAVGCFGIIPKKYAKKGTPKPGDFILTIGGKTGRDGIHGATFSSKEMQSDTTDTSGSAVQIGNAIEEKRVIDLVLALRDRGLIRAITDCGAGGYSSAIGEMGEKTGVKIYLERVPLKYASLNPWEIFLSESQERMVLAVAPDSLKEIQRLAKLYNVESTMIGECTRNKRLQVFYKNKTVCDLDMEFLHNGLPKKTLVGITTKRAITESLPEEPRDYKKVWKQILSNGNVCSKESIVRLYDHNVQGTTALHPFGGIEYDGPNDGSIVTPLYGKSIGLGVSHGLNPTFMNMDPYRGSIWAITEAIANYVSFGGDISKAALIDNFIWPYPDEESLADLHASVNACVEMAKILKMPFVSGKDSLSSTYRYSDGTLLKIPPVLLISVFGPIKNVKKTVSSDIKKTDSTLVLIGSPDTKHLGGSVYFDEIHASSKFIPQIDSTTLSKIFSSITSAIDQRLLLSCHDISEGGLLTSITEMCFGGGIGVEINLKSFSQRPDFVLFNETAGNFVAEIDDIKKFEKHFKNIPYKVLGRTNSSKNITITQGKTHIVNASLDELKEAWKKPMQKYFS